MTCVATCIKPSPSNAHCGACHRTFGSVTGFDLHRRGGQCTDPATIAGQRLDANGIWRFEGVENRAAIHSRDRGLPVAAETGSPAPPATPGPSDATETLSGAGCCPEFARTGYAHTEICCEVDA